MKIFGNARDRRVSCFFWNGFFFEKKHRLEMDEETHSKVNYLSCWNILEIGEASRITERDGSIASPKLIDRSFWKFSLHQQSWELSYLALVDFCFFSKEERDGVFSTVLKNKEPLKPWLRAKVTVLTAMVRIYFLFLLFEKTFKKCKKVFFFPTKRMVARILFWQ